MLNPDNATLEWCAKWIEDSLRAETNERTIEFGNNMAMTIRAVKTSNATSPSTVARKAADLFPKSTYKDKRQLSDKERFALNAALNDYQFNNCDHEHDGDPNHLACRWCVLEVIAAIIERCL